jgi:hypothetical protein
VRERETETNRRGVDEPIGKVERKGESGVDEPIGEGERNGDQ